MYKISTVLLLIAITTVAAFAQKKPIKPALKPTVKKVAPQKAVTKTQAINEVEATAELQQELPAATKVPLKSTVVQKIAFKNGKSKALTGTLIGEMVEKNSINDNQSKYKYIYSRKGNAITVCIYKEWVVPTKGFDALEERTFDINIMNTDDDRFEIDENEPDDSYAAKYYSFSFRAVDDKEFTMNEYNVYESKPNGTRTFSTFTVKSANKQSLQAMIDDIKSIAPKKAE